MGLVSSAQDVADRYDRLAWIHPLFDLVFSTPPRARRLAVERLALAPGETVIDVGCGTGVNLPRLEAAVGPRGRVVGIDVSPGMLRRAARRVRGSDVVTVTCADAATVDLEPADAVLLTLAYSVLPDRALVLDRVWEALRPGGRIAIMDAGADGRFGHLVRPLVRVVSRWTILGDPDVRPWEDLARFGVPVERRTFHLGTYSISSVTKPGDGVAAPSVVGRSGASATAVPPGATDG